MSTVFETEVTEVKRLKDEEKLTFEAIGKVMGFSARTAQRRYAAAILTDSEREEQDFPSVEPRSIVLDGFWLDDDRGPIERFKPLVVTGDAMVTSDWHIPLHDPKLINKMLEQAANWDIRKLIINGDYFHMETFSSFLPYQPEASLKQERYDGAYIMTLLGEYFDEITFGWGNHDFRLVKKLGFKHSFEEAMKWMLSDVPADVVEKIRFTNLDYMLYYPKPNHTISPHAGKWYICHPRNFSSIPLTVGRKLAQKLNCNVITGHSHHCAIGAAPNGRHVVIEGGGFYDKSRTEYVQQSTTHHEWVQGFTMFWDGVPTVFSPIFKNI